MNTYTALNVGSQSVSLVAAAVTLVVNIVTAQMSLEVNRSAFSKAQLTIIVSH